MRQPRSSRGLIRRCQFGAVVQTQRVAGRTCHREQSAYFAVAARMSDGRAEERAIGWRGVVEDKACTTGLDDQVRGAERLRQCQARSEEHTSELQSRLHLVCRLLLEKKKNQMLQIGAD